VACLAVGTALLGGCSEKQEASSDLPSAAASSSKPELPPLGPADFPVPDEARQKTPEGALAFAKYYIALGDQIGSGTIPPRTLLDLSDGCGLCRQVASSYEADRAAGITYSGSTYSFKEYALPRLSGETAELGFVYSQSAYKALDARGHEVPARAGKASGKLQSGMLLKWRDDLQSWVVTSLTIG